MVCKSDEVQMETLVESMVVSALQRMKTEGLVPTDFDGPVVIERPKFESFGDFGCALPLSLTRVMRKPPAVCAQILIEHISADAKMVQSVEFAPPGYVNFKLTQSAWFARLATVGSVTNVGRGEKVLLEYVSANPTGPLHAGHARGAVLGDALARLMKVAGYDVSTEYLLNDVGNQMAMLGLSLYARGRETLGLLAEFPENGYQGEYVRTLATDFVATPEGRLACERPYEEIGTRDDNIATRFAAEKLALDIHEVLERTGISFDRWFSERDLHKDGSVDKCVKDLVAEGQAYRNDDGAILFKMEGDEEDDRVIVRSNGIPTYFAADIAYHDDKARRGFDRLINIWGADHHGYIPRVKAALGACGHNPDILQVILVQMVSLTRGGEVIPMGKRAGRFVTMSDLLDEVGTDAVRFLFLLRKADAQMEFDLELAKAQTPENPVFYVQYGHARVASIIRKALAEGHQVPEFSDDLGKILVLPEEQRLIRDLCSFEGIITGAARRSEPHHVAFYLMELVKGFHSYYTRYKHSEKVVSASAEKTAARLFLVSRIREVLAQGLGILGVSAPEEMRYEANDGEEGA